jgi:hypothetical protein
MKKAIFAAAAVAALAVPASAQYTSTEGVSVRAGVFFPADTGAQNESDLWMGFGVDYKLPGDRYSYGRRQAAKTYTISADWYGSGNYANMPVLVNVVNRSGESYWSAGAGIGFVRTPIEGGSSTGSKFTFQLSYGREAVRQGRQSFFEARYWGSAESQLRGFGVYAGLRF